MELTYDLEEIGTAAAQFVEVVSGFKVFAFHGNMGVGKTTMIQAICNVLQTIDRVASPTFSIINTYHTKDGDTIHHIDLYRVKDRAEAMHAGVEECLYSGHMCFVEWPERIFKSFPIDTVQVFLSLEGPSKRKITVKFP